MRRLPFPLQGSFADKCVPSGNGRWSGKSTIPLSDDKKNLGDFLLVTVRLWENNTFFCGMECLQFFPTFSCEVCFGFPWKRGTHWRTVRWAWKVTWSFGGCLSEASLFAGDHHLVRGVGPGEQRRGVCLSLGQAAHVTHRATLPLAGSRQHCFLRLAIHW